MKNMKGWKMVAAAIFLIVASLPVMAQGRFSGLVFGDYYYIISNHNDMIQGMNGFWVRRLYFTYDYKFSSSWKMRIRFEANDKGDFRTKTTVNPFVKDLYLQWSGGKTAVIFGISPTPTFNRIEHIWGYRAVEKTPPDLYKIDHSRDFGIAVKGNLGKAIYYHLMVANGEGNKTEINKDKKFRGALGVIPTRGVYFEVYGDYETSEASNPVYTMQAFASFTGKKFRVGAEYSHQVHNVKEGESLKVSVASMFAVARLGKKLNALLRYDRMLNPLPGGSEVSYIPFDPTSKFNLIIAGLEYKVSGHISLIPNIEYVSYDSLNRSDLFRKITLYYKW